MKGLISREYASFLAEEGNTMMPEMFSQALPQALVGGKTVEVLAALRKRRIIHPSSSSWKRATAISDLPVAFVNAVRENLQQGDAEASEVGGKEAGRVDPFLSGFDPGDLDVDPYLALAFAEVCCQEREDEAEGEESYSGALLVGPVDPLLPVPLILSRCLSSLVAPDCESARTALSSAVLVQLDLRSHLAAARRVFLMGAGDLMAEFSRDLFRRLEDDLDLESSSVTLFLQDCLARR